MSRIDSNFRKPPAPQPAKPKRLSRQKRKRMAEDAEYNAMRDIYLEENPSCVYCGQQSTQVHHIVRGKDRRKGLRNPSGWLEVCGVCHDLVEKLSWEIQACIKQNAVLRTIERLRGGREEM